MKLTIFCTLGLLIVASIVFVMILSCYPGLKSNITKCGYIDELGLSVGYVKCKPDILQLQLTDSGCEMASGLEIDLVKWYYGRKVFETWIVKTVAVYEITNDGEGIRKKIFDMYKVQWQKPEVNKDNTIVLYKHNFKWFP